jgi:dGTPase
MSWIINKIVVDSVQMIKIDMDDYLKKYSPDTDGNYYPLREQIASKDTVLRKIKLYSELEKIENNYVLNNYKINLIDGKAKYVLRRIFKAYLTNPKQLPDSVLRKYTKVCNIDGLKQEIEIIGLNEKTRNIRYLDGDLFKKYQNEIITDNWFLRVVCDYISSMTDLFCISEYQKLYGGDSIGDNQPYTMN